MSEIPDNDRQLEAAIEQGHLDAADQQSPELAQQWAAHQKVESLFAQLRGSPGSTDEAAEETPLPSQIGRYQVQQLLGQGTFGNVYQGYDAELERTVAIKVPRQSLVAESSDEQFLREARAAAQLSHPNIVSVHEVAREADQTYIVSEFIDGVSMDQWRKADPLDAEKAVRLCLTITGAIAHAHEQGIVHRDLKPSNIMMDNQAKPYVMDFGLAKRQSVDATMTMEGKILGTPAYMSPEQARGENQEVDVRSDVYALGVILFELLTGERPFRGSTQMLLNQVIHEDAPDPKKLNSLVPRDLSTICLKCLEKSPVKRYQTALQLADELTCFLDGKPITARPVTWMERSWRWCKRKPAVAGLWALATVLLLMLSIGGLVALKQAELRGQAERQKGIAETKEQEAAANADEARQNLKVAERNAYYSDMLLATRDWEVANIGHLRELLERHRYHEDLKGFEWYYWNRCVDTGLFTLEGHSSPVNSVAYSPDGKRIVSGSDDETVKVWDADSGQQILTFQGHSGEVWSVAYSPDGKRIVSGGDDTTLKVWDTETGQLAFALEGHSSTVNSVAYSPDGKRIVSGGDDTTLKVWDTETRQLAFALEGLSSPVKSVAYSPDGKRIVSGSDDKTVKVWDADSGQLVHTLHGHSGVVYSVAFSPDGKRIVSGSDDKTVKVWDVDRGLARTFSGHSVDVLSVAFSPDGEQIVSGSDDNTVKVWNADSGQLVFTLRGHSDGIWSVIFSPDGKRIVSGSGDNTLKVWDSKTPQQTLTLEGHSSPVNSAAFSPDGERIVSGSNDKTAKIWNADSGQLALTLEGHSSPVNSVAYSPDGKRIVSGSDDKTVKVWDADSGQLVRTIKGHSSEVWGRGVQPRREANCQQQR